MYSKRLQERVTVPKPPEGGNSQDTWSRLMLVRKPYRATKYHIAFRSSPKPDNIQPLSPDYLNRAGFTMAPSQRP